MAMINYADKVALNSNSGIADIYKCNASDMNLIKDVVNDLIDTIGTTYEYILTPVPSNYDIAGWRTMATNYTTGVIPAGTYLMIFKFTVSSGQSAVGLTTTRAMIDEAEINPQTRITIPTGSATMSGEIIAPVTFATSTTHTLNGNTYPLYQAITAGTHRLSYSFIRIK